MGILQRIRLGATVLVAGLVLGSFPVLTTTQAAVIRPVPSVTGHILTRNLAFPPDTSYCQTNFGISCYQPAQIQKAYNLAPLFNHHIDGRGTTIVIVDAFGSPTIAHDLAVFDQTFGIPDPPSLRIIQPAGAVPPFDATNGDHVGWAQETTLDVEWSHVIAPGANILLVETPVAETEGVQGFPEIVQAENYVIDHNLGDVITQSFGATEETFPNTQSIFDLRSAFINARRHHVTVLASTGDTGATNYMADFSCCYPFAVNSWPAADPLITSIGGTQLHLDANGNRLAPDEVWNDGFGATGGGLSHVFRRPNFQNDQRRVVGNQRGTPDISMSAAVDGGVDVYYSFLNPASGWHVFGGTSEASPLFAGIVALADQFAGHRLGFLNRRLYQMAADPHSGIVDVTKGNNSLTFQDATGQTITVTGFTAGRRYDLASGWGTVDASRFVRALAAMADDNGNDDP